MEEVVVKYYNFQLITMTDTSDLIYVYSQVPVDVPLRELENRWHKECLDKNLNAYITENGDDKITCVSMLGHPFDTKDDGYMNTSVVFHILVVAPMYTVYKLTDKEKEKTAETWKIADTDSFNLLEFLQWKENGEEHEIPFHSFQKECLVQKVQFLSERSANRTISKDLLKGKKCWYSNTHNLIDEFVYKSRLQQCSTKNCNNLSGRLFSQETGTVPICSKCRPNDRHVGENIRTPKVLDLSRLDSVENPEDFVFCKPKHIVDKEYITFSLPEDLPFISGNVKLDQQAIDCFSRYSKVAVFDIETIPIDSENKKIPDEIITIQIVLTVNKKLTDLVIITRNLPACWESGGIKNTKEFFSAVLNEEQLKGVQKEDGSFVDIKVFHSKSEKQLLRVFEEFVLKYKPHFLVSFNGEGFDFKMLIRSSFALNMMSSPQDPRSIAEKLDHLKHNIIQRLNSSGTVLSPQLRESLQRPHGKLCSGLISDKDLTLDYDVFPCTISVDLFKLEQSSLKDACKKRNVDIGKLEGVSHVDIPKLYYQKDIRFWQYGLIDSLATEQLLRKVWFQAIEVFPELEGLVGTPWNLSMSRKKTQNAITTQYIQYISNRFLTPAIIRPKGLLAKYTVKQLVSYFFEDIDPVEPNAVQIITDFTNGHCKCNTSFKKYEKQFGSIMSNKPITMNLLRKVIMFDRNHNIKKGEDFSTKNACIILHYLSRWVKYPEDVLLREKEFSSLVRKYQSKYTKPSVQETRGLQLAKYLAYLLQVRVNLSPYEEHKLLWKSYSEFYKTDAVVGDLKTFTKKHHREILQLVLRKKSLFRHRSLEEGTSIDNVTECFDPLKLSMLTFDGALILYKGDDSESEEEDNDMDEDEEDFIEEEEDLKEMWWSPNEKTDSSSSKLLDRKPTYVFPPPQKGEQLIKRGINLDDIVVVYDFKSQYPYSMISINLGKDTHVSTSTVYACLSYLQELYPSQSMQQLCLLLTTKYLHCCHTRRIDDTYGLEKYVSDKEYVAKNYVFFIKMLTSVQNVQFMLEIESRVTDKKKSQDSSLSPSERKMYANRSETKKITINSRYGLIQSTIDPRFQPTVTGMGRKSIRKVTSCLRQHMDTREFYGDSVTGYTPVLLKGSDGTVVLTQFNNVEPDDVKWIKYPVGTKEELPLNPNSYQVQTHEGWQNVIRIIRHKTTKKIYRVTTNKGVVDVTEDHSLMTKKLEQMSPMRLVPHETLLWTLPENVFEEEQICIQMSATQASTEFPLNKKRAFLLGVYFVIGNKGGKRWSMTFSEKYKTTLLQCQEILLEEFQCNSHVEFLATGDYTRVILCNNICRFLNYTHKYNNVLSRDTDKNSTAMELWCDKNCFVWNGEKNVKVVPNIILSSHNKNFQDSFFQGVKKVLKHPLRFTTSYQITTQSFIVLLQQLWYSIGISTPSDNTYEIVWKKNIEDLKDADLMVQSVVEIFDTDTSQYVYDIETSVGTFHAGIGGLVLKNTDSCFIYKRGLSPFNMVKMSCNEMYEKLLFEKLLNISLEEFEEQIYKKHYPVQDLVPRKIREAASSVMHQLCVKLESQLSSTYLELEAEKTLNPIILPTAKRYIAYNGVAQKILTKGLSLNNKSASKLTKEILSFLINLCIDSWNYFEIASGLYHKLGSCFLEQINKADENVLDLISKPISIDLQKLKKGSKQQRLLTRMSKEGINFLFDKVHLKVVPIEPIDGDTGWSLYAVGEQKGLSPTQLHLIKAKFDVMQEIMVILTSTFCKEICEPFTKLIVNEYYPERYSPHDFKRLHKIQPQKTPAASFSSILKLSKTKKERGDIKSFLFPSKLCPSLQQKRTEVFRDRFNKKDSQNVPKKQLQITDIFGPFKRTSSEMSDNDAPCTNCKKVRI